MIKSKFPHPLTLLLGCILLAAALTYILPAGEYDRKHDDAANKDVAVAGSYHRVPQQPVTPFQAFVEIPKGLIDAADVIFFVFLVGGAFTVVDETGALKQSVSVLVKKLQNHQTLVIPIVSILFAIGGAVENMQEEILAMVPVLLLLTRRSGFKPLTAVAMSLGAAAVGAAFSPVNPFQVLIAQKVAEMPPGSGWKFRLVFLVIALAIWIAGTVAYAKRNRVEPEADEKITGPFDARKMIVLAVVLVSFAFFIVGIIRWGWDFTQMTAVFFIMGIAVGLIGGLGVTGTANSFVEGFKSMAFAGILIGFARAISVLMRDGKIIDTVVNGLVIPLGHLPVALSAVGMMFVHVLVHVPVPSVSGQAALTMPILAPTSDLIGLSRQVAVLAYQYGAGLCELLTPTNGALMAIIAAAGVRYDEWLKFAIKLFAVLFVLGIIAVIVGIAIGLQ